MRRVLRAAAVFAVVLLVALQVQTGGGQLDDREVRLAVIIAAVAALLSYRRFRR